MAPPPPPPIPTLSSTVPQQTRVRTPGLRGDEDVQPFATWVDEIQTNTLYQKIQRELSQDDESIITRNQWYCKISVVKLYAVIYMYVDYENGWDFLGLENWFLILSTWQEGDIIEHCIDHYCLFLFLLSFSAEFSYVLWSTWLASNLFPLS